MKQIKNISRILGLVIGAGLTMTSCDLDMLPLNDVVLENYWTDKEDVEKSLTSCYVAMEEGDWIRQAIIWGEVRSDNIAERQGATRTPTYLQNIIKGNLKQNNAACNWGAFYKVINYCNSVIYYAPQVAEKDPNITPSILAETLAQAKAIRALNYFYLVRTFKDVPFSMEPSIDDTQDYLLPATAGETILDALISDLEACKNDARRMYATNRSSASYQYNTAKITRAAIYALLADIYLWRASDARLDVNTQQQFYRQCIANCEYVIQEKINLRNSDVMLQNSLDPDIFSKYGYPLLREDAVGTGGSTLSAAAYASIFGKGGSFESIFELSFVQENGTEYLKNSAVSNMYGSMSENRVNLIAELGASKNLLSGAPTSASFKNEQNTLFTTYNDYRSVTSFIFDEKQSTFYNICKYSATSRSNFKLGSSDWTAGAVSESSYWQRTPNSSYQPWIIYRLTDIMLMKAEAEIELANILDPVWKSSDATHASVEADDLFNDAFNLISAVYTRSNPVAKTTATAGPQLGASNIDDYAQMVILVENERHREFLFEGKRYYDLVRRARREGNTEHIGTILKAKFDDAPKAFLVKMVQMDFMYMPYAESELKVNPNLHQNPVYAEEDKNQKN